MPRVLMLVVIAALTLPAFATDSRLGEPDADWPEFQFYETVLVQAEVLICLDTDANPGFSDLTPLYYAAFSAAGASPIATCAVEVSGGTINFPPDLTGDNYPIVVVLTGENWWSAPQNIDAADEAVLADYLDSGGNLLIVGQDYMYGAHPTMGACTGFPFDYLGLDHCDQDVLWGPNSAHITGSTDGIFEGESVILDSANVFISNPFFPDCADPTPSAQYGFYYVDAARNGVVILNETEMFRTVWSGIELAGAQPEVLYGLIEKIYDWFVGTTPVESRSWGRIKALYNR